MNRWPGLPPAYWLTDYRSEAEREQELYNKLKAKSSLDYKHKLEMNAKQVYEEYDRSKTPQLLCPMCKPNQHGLVDSLRAPWDRK